MQTFMVTSILVSTIVGTIVGIKLLLLASRTRQFPEFSVGAALFCYAAIAQPALLVSASLGPDLSHEHQMVLLAIRLLAYYSTLVGLSAFAWQVFGAASRWRKALTVTLALTALFTAVLSYWASWNQLGINGQVPLYARFSTSLQYVIMFAWMSVESLAYYRQMRKRQVLGLADVVVTNRFGVWGVSAGASSVLVLCILFISLTRPDALGNDPLSAALVSATGVVSSVGWWLSFMPPAAYLRWLRRQNASEVSHG